jgi:site-specific recombinase XerD
MHPDTPSKYLSAFGKKYGIENLHPHKLRHSFASISLTNGADVVSVSELLGHADTSITLRTYSHASEESRKKAAGIFQNAIHEKSTQKA